MDIQFVFEQLESATDFELFRLNLAIQKLLEDPDRQSKLRKKIKLGMETSFFCEDRNKNIACIVNEIKRTRVGIVEIESKKGWSMPFYYLNLSDIDTSLMSSRKTGLSKAEIAIGDTVGFVHPKDNEDHIGIVEKLNPKRVVISEGNRQWQVPYSMLFPVLSGEASESRQVLLLGDRHK